MAIEDFEWQGDIEQPQVRLAAAAEGVGETRSAGWLSKLKKSVWLEPAVRLFGVALLLGVLAGIGVVATTYAKPGLTLPEGSRVLTDALGTGWLKPTPAPPAAASATAAHAQPSTGRAVAAHAPSSAPPTAGASAVAAGADAAVVATDPVAAPEPPPRGVAPAGMTPDGKVILNLASADELTKLPGVGMKRANAIVALRTKLKRFKHATDLLRVKGIGPRGLQRMLPHLVLDAPAAS